MHLEKGCFLIPTYMSWQTFLLERALKCLPMCLKNEISVLPGATIFLLFYLRVLERSLMIAQPWHGIAKQSFDSKVAA